MALAAVSRKSGVKLAHVRYPVKLGEPAKTRPLSVAEIPRLRGTMAWPRVWLKERAGKSSSEYSRRTA